MQEREGETGYRVLVGGGMGRTPYIGYVVGDFVAKPDILAFLEACMRVYNEQGRRDNIYKARIKILANALGPRKCAGSVDARIRRDQGGGHPGSCRTRNWRASTAYFAPPEFETWTCSDGIPTRRCKDFRRLDEDQRPSRIARRAMPSPRFR